jgi:hypothetical protein
LSGSSSGSSPVLSWSAVSTTNTSATTSYRIYRSVWDASTYTWTEQANYVGSTTSTSYTDSPFSSSATYVGTSLPAECVYTYAIYWVVAYNAGISSGSPQVYFQGGADGATPWQLSCP